MTDNEIIKAFEYCPQTRACTHTECPLFSYEEIVEECAAELNKKVRDLIQRQQKYIDKSVKDLKWWLDTNTEKGVVYIPEFVIENIVKGVQNGK